MLSRRQFVASSAAAAVAAWTLPRSTHAQAPVTAPVYPPERLSSGVIVLTGDGGNILLVPTSEGPLMVDAKFSYSVLDLGPIITEQCGRMPIMLINTHHHGDHSGGNWGFAESGQIVGHKNLKPRLAANMENYRRAAQTHLSAQRGQASAERMAQFESQLGRIIALRPADFAPQREIDDGEDLKLGEVAFQVRHFGAGHTDNDLVVFLPAQNVIHMGDLVFNRWHPFIDRSAKADTEGWQKSLRAALKLCNDETIVIPGHGKVDDKAAIERQIAYFDALRALVGDAMKQGRSKEEILKLDSETFSGYEARLKQRAFEGMYDELVATRGS